MPCNSGRFPILQAGIGPFRAAVETSGELAVYNFNTPLWRSGRSNRNGQFPAPVTPTTVAPAGIPPGKSVYGGAYSLVLDPVNGSPMIKDASGGTGISWHPNGELPVPPAVLPLSSPPCVTRGCFLRSAACRRVPQVHVWQL